MRSIVRLFAVYQGLGLGLLSLPVYYYCVWHVLALWIFFGSQTVVSSGFTACFSTLPLLNIWNYTAFFIKFCCSDMDPAQPPLQEWMAEDNCGKLSDNTEAKLICWCLHQVRMMPLKLLLKSCFWRNQYHLSNCQSYCRWSILFKRICLMNKLL